MDSNPLILPKKTRLTSLATLSSSGSNKSKFEENYQNSSSPNPSSTNASSTSQNNADSFGSSNTTLGGAMKKKFEPSTGSTRVKGVKEEIVRPVAVKKVEAEKDRKPIKSENSAVRVAFQAGATKPKSSLKTGTSNFLSEMVAATISSNEARSESKGSRVSFGSSNFDKANNIKSDFSFRLTDDERTNFGAESSYKPTIIPSTTPEAISTCLLPENIYSQLPHESSAYKFFSKERKVEDFLFLVQLPSHLPHKNALSNMKEDELMGIESTEEKLSDNAASNRVYMDKLAEEMFDTNYSENIKYLNGMAGKLVVTKSGKLKFKIGNIIMDVREGSMSKAHQQIVNIDSNTDKALVIDSTVSKKLVISFPLDITPQLKN